MKPRSARIDARPVHRGETGGFDTHRAGPDELQRGDIDLGEDRVWRGGFGRGSGRAGGNGRWRGPWRGGPRRGDDEASGVALGQGFDGLGFGKHAGLSGEQGLDPGAQARPIAPRQNELAAQIEQGDLADLFAGAFGGDETEGDVGFVGGFIPGRGFADEHGGKVGLAAGAINGFITILWHYKGFSKFIGGFPGVFGSSLRWEAEKVLKMG